uniref:Uncharacterized protein n=1 Tax=Anguilla anguilla TaxID=7936 RepID=A0A0E9T1K8_ANGAN
MRLQYPSRLRKIGEALLTHASSFVAPRTNSRRAFVKECRYTPKPFMTPRVGSPVQYKRYSKLTESA